MKNLVLTLLFACFMLVANNSLAQTKIGHLDSAELLQGLPEWQTAQKEVQTFMEMKKKDLAAKNQVLVDDYNKLVEQDNKGLLTPLDKQKKGDEMQKRQDALQQEQAKAEEELDAKQTTLTDPIRKKVKDAIAAVAKEKGYNYIIDNSAGVLLYDSPTDDISAFVKDKLR